MNKKKIQMSKEAEEALLGSIQKWVDIVWNGGSDEGSDNCPLCRMHGRILECSWNCPVKKHTRRNDCDGSPYRKWDSYAYYTRFRRVFDKKSKALAKEELNFLISLYPGEIELVWEYKNKRKE